MQVKDGVVTVNGEKIGRVLTLSNGKFGIMPEFHFDRRIYKTEKAAISKLLVYARRVGIVPQSVAA